MTQCWQQLPRDVWLHIFMEWQSQPLLALASVDVAMTSRRDRATYISSINHATLTVSNDFKLVQLGLFLNWAHQRRLIVKGVAFDCAMSTSVFAPALSVIQSVKFTNHCFSRDGALKVAAILRDCINLQTLSLGWGFEVNFLEILPLSKVLSSSTPKLSSICLCADDDAVLHLVEVLGDKMKSMEINGAKATWRCIEHVAQHCPQLKDFCRPHCDSSPAAISALAQLFTRCVGLERLSISQASHPRDDEDCSTAVALVREMAGRLPRLKVLDLRYWARAHPLHILPLLSHCAHLETVQTHCFGLCIRPLGARLCLSERADGVCELLLALRTPLLHLVLADGDMDHLRLRDLLTCGGATLEHLDVEVLPVEAQRECFETVPQHCRRLRTLAISHCARLDDKGLETLTVSCLELESVKLRSCSRITDRGLRTLMSAPKLRKLAVARCLRVGMGWDDLTGFAGLAIE